MDKQQQEPTNETLESSKKGRPTVDPTWPQGKFTFKSLSTSNKGNLCDSSLRNKVKKALKEGEIKKVSLHKGDVGRPQDVYLSSSPLQVNNSKEQEQVPQLSCQSQQQDQAGQNMPLN